MKHCYIFDYSRSNIYHTKLSDDIVANTEYTENYLHNYFKFKLSDIYYMITENELNITEL